MVLQGRELYEPRGIWSNKPPRRPRRSHGAIASERQSSGRRSSSCAPPPQ
jgi:hypothetical protein